LVLVARVELTQMPPQKVLEELTLFLQQLHLLAAAVVLLVQATLLIHKEMVALVVVELQIADLELERQIKVETVAMVLGQTPTLLQVVVAEPVE
jgi:hypothetical protein